MMSDLSVLALDAIFSFTDMKVKSSTTLSDLVLALASIFELAASISASSCIVNIDFRFLDVFDDVVGDLVAFDVDFDALDVGPCSCSQKSRQKSNMLDALLTVTSTQVTNFISYIHSW